MLIGCGQQDINTEDKIENDNIKSITITALPSPPKTKIIDNQDDINKVVYFINTIDKNKLKKQDVKGWEIKVDIIGEENTTISFISNMIHINDNWYEIDKNILAQFREIYNQLKYEEKDIN